MSKSNISNTKSGIGFTSDNVTFDYIIIGAGTSGGVIAKKLTDDKSTSVLVLEAGTNISNPSPSFVTAGIVANDNKIAFQAFSNVEQNIERQLKLWSGRVIGGTSQQSNEMKCMQCAEAASFIMSGQISLGVNGVTRVCVLYS
jgi:choline dehydrogenase-like flavoprotein